MKRKILCVLTSLVLLLALATLTSCSDKVSKEEAAAEVTRLVKESYELNVIYFGEGLPYTEDTEDEDGKNLYAPVAEDASFVTKEALTYKTRTVFSKDYAASMIETAFQGGVAPNGSVLYARYIVSSDGKLTVYKNIKGIEKEVNEYDYSTVTITKISKRFIKANITSTGGKVVEVILINQDGEWRIDSPTY
ncbi:MAG: hypothetical protein ACI3XX_01185 [Eubacteriales bacterium]